VIKGSSLNRDTTGVRDTITVWAETTRVVNDSTWIIRYYGGPYNGYEDTFFVFIRGDSVILNIKYNFKPPTDATVIPIDLKAPFGIYPLIYPLRWDTPWDTLPPANYIGGPQADTIAYKLHAEGFKRYDRNNGDVRPEGKVRVKCKGGLCGRARKRSYFNAPIIFLLDPI